MLLIRDRLFLGGVDDIEKHHISGIRISIDDDCISRKKWVLLTVETGTRYW